MLSSLSSVAAMEMENRAINLPWIAVISYNQYGLHKINLIQGERALEHKNRTDLMRDRLENFKIKTNPSPSMVINKNYRLIKSHSVEKKNECASNFHWI